jgi:NTE family protein
MLVRELNTMKRFLTAIMLVVLAGAALISQGVFAQTTTSHASAAHRPRVALALSGGGSLGLAHVGVLRYFEEHHIPVDAIAGTSMGGIVGGLYATGHTTEEIERAFTEAGWQDVIRTQANYVDLPIESRQDRALHPGGYAVRLGRDLSLPAGLATGESFDLFLSRQVLAYSAVQDFSLLPTPFRCVATQLQNGEPMVLQRGNLARAMRATMSVPGIFTPVEWEGNVLVDGGLSDNLPVDVARQMDVDVVIGVHFNLPVPPKKQLQSLPNVLTQAVSVAVAETERESLRNADLVLAPSLVDIAGIDYGHVHELVERGYQAAQQKARFLETLALNDADWAAYQAERRGRMKSAVAEPMRVTVQSSDPSLARHAQSGLDEAMTLDQLERKLSKLTAGSALPAAFYRLGLSDEAGQQNPQRVIAEADPRQASLLVIRPSLELAVANGEPTRGTVMAFTTVLPSGSYTSRYRFKAAIGYSPQLAAEYESRFGSSHWFWSPSLDAQRQNSATYSGDQHFTHWDDTYSGAFDLGYGTETRFRVRAGVEAGYERPSGVVFPGARSASVGAMIAPRLTADWNTLDDGSLPTRGSMFTSSMIARYRSADGRTVPLGRASFEEYRPLHAGVLSGGLAGGSSFGTKLNYFDLFPVGGPDDLRAFRYQQFHATDFAQGEVAYRVPITGFRLFGGSPQLGGWYDAAGVRQPLHSWQSEQSGSLGVLVNSPLGVISLAVGRTSDGQTRGWIRVGRP